MYGHLNIRKLLL